MSSIIIHTPQNEISRTYRYYNFFWEKFVEFLETKFDVIKDTYYEHANVRSYPVELLNSDSQSEMLECEMIIENTQTKEFVVLSVCDHLTGATLNHQSNDLCKKIIICQYDETCIRQHLRREENIFKFLPWIYFPSNVFDIDSLYERRKNVTKFTDKFCFWGTSLEDRSILSHFNPDLFDGGRPIGTFESYASHLIQYKIALSVSGRGEFCYRDIENFGLGVPIIRFQFNNKMHKELVPNFHYISVDRPDDMVYDRTGEKHHAEMLERRFVEVKDDKDFLDFISKNARQYYEDNLIIDSSIKLTYNLLELYDWE